MIYYTGDIHGEEYEIVRFCNRFHPTKEDTIVILGDVGANFFADERDVALKKALNKVKPTILCIHGNHEMRPWNIPSYKTKEWNGGIVWYEDAYPTVLFAKDGEIYDIEGLKHIAIGGAYSVDKYYRIARRCGWWDDEQPSEEIKRYVEEQLRNNSIDVILSHTCPFKYEPVETFLPGVDQSTVDDSTERWLDYIEETTDYLAWYCGHWHINKRIDKMHFLYHKFESSEDVSKLVLVKKATDDSVGIGVGGFNSMTIFAVRYALERDTGAPHTIERVLSECLPVLYKETKHIIKEDIEDHFKNNERATQRGTWMRIVQMIREDLERNEKK